MLTSRETKGGRERRRYFEGHFNVIGLAGAKKSGNSTPKIDKFENEVLFDFIYCHPVM